MKFKWSKGKIFLLLILGAFAIHFLFFRAPSEAQMIAKFHANKAQFEQLRLMLAHDKNVKDIGPDWTNAKYKKMPDGVEMPQLPLNVSDKRFALYRARMKQLGISMLLVDERRDLVRFSVFGGGFTDTSWSIGYVYSKNIPNPLVKSAYYQMPGREGIHFSRIEGNWYIYNRH